MERRTDMMVEMRRLIKLYEMGLDGIRKKYGLTMVEITIISFLYNNPGRDTAADIADIRMLPKGQVSQATAALLARGLLSARRDRRDRRRIHLALQEAASPVVAEIETAGEHFLAAVYQGISEEELLQYRSVQMKIMENVKANLGKGENRNDK